VVSTLAGSGIQGAADGASTVASFNQPSGVAVDNTGNVYVADTGNNKIRVITPSGVVSTLAGSGVQGSAEGNGAGAAFFFPSGVAVDAAGSVYVADSRNNKIRKVTSAGVVSTLAGSGAPGSLDGAGTTAAFSSPLGVVVGASGVVYVADTDNNKIRKITGEPAVATTLVVSASPNPASTGQTVTLSASVTGSAPTGLVQFFDAGASLGAAQPLASGLATLETSSLATGSHTITASYLGDAGNLASTSEVPVALVINQALAASSTALSIDPPTPTVGQTVTLTATVTGLSPTGSVQFMDGAINLDAPVSLMGGSATLSTSTLTVGAHSITAVYSGDTNNTASSSPPASITVATGSGGGSGSGDVPTLPEWGLILLGMTLLMQGWRRMAR
jgi:hypothetical protein